MALTRQTQVLEGLDALAGKSLRRARREYRKGVIEPLLKEIKEAHGFEELLGGLGAPLWRRMDSAGLEKQVAQTMTQAGMIGTVSATPSSRNGAEVRSE